VAKTKSQFPEFKEDLPKPSEEKEELDSAPEEPKSKSLNLEICISFTFEEMLALKERYMERPAKMNKLDFPCKIKKKDNKNFFNKQVDEIRFLLNKLSRHNFKTIKDKILAIEYTPSLLKELSVSF
jgi:hypothetical protein